MKRTYLRVDLALDTPWRVGVWRAQAARDVATARNPMQPDAAAAPGSSVLGSLRSAALQLGVDVQLFGGEVAGPAGELNPSIWWLLGVQMGSTDQIQMRQETPIDRHRRAAAKDGLHSAEEVVVGDASKLSLYFRADDADVDALERVLRAWTPMIGGGMSVGLGQAHVSAVKYRTVDLARLNDVSALLTGDDHGPARVERLLKEGTTLGVSSVEGGPSLSVEFVAGPLEIRDDQGWVTRGSQWKGLLRSRVELIARSLGHPACMAEEGKGWTGCGRCDLCEAFGSAETGIGAWTFEDSHWRGEGAERVDRNRIALDRFTGGTRRQVLFDQTSVSGVELTLLVSQRRPVEAWVWAALVHAVRDIHDGIVGLGGRTGIGLGSLTAKEAYWRGLTGSDDTESRVDWEDLPSVVPAWQEQSA